MEPVKRPVEPNRPNPKKQEESGTLAYFLQATLVLGLILGGVYYTWRYFQAQTPAESPAATAPPQAKAPTAKRAAALPLPENYYEAEDLPLIAKSREFGWGQVAMDNVKDDGPWFRDTHMLASQVEENDWIELEMPKVKPGEYLLTVYMTKVWYYGIVQFFVNGQKIGNPIDLFAEQVLRTGPLALGRVKLTGQADKLRLQAVGKNPSNQSKVAEFALDGIQLTR